jgi:hypothetical protein
MQLKVIATLTLAVLVLGEPYTVLQIAGGVIMLSGALITQRQTLASLPAAAANFTPRHAEGLFSRFWPGWPTAPARS